MNYRYLIVSLAIGLMAFSGVSLAETNGNEKTVRNNKNSNAQTQMKMMFWMQQRQQLEASLSQKMSERTNIEKALETVARMKEKDQQYGLAKYKAEVEKQEKMLTQRLSVLDSEISKVQKKLSTKFK